MIGPTFDYPAIYRIKVKGRISKKWGYRLAGMTIHQVESLGEFPVTILEGELSDQADLAGLLNTLYELHLPLLEVAYLDDDQNAENHLGKESIVI